MGRNFLENLETDSRAKRETGRDQRDRAKGPSLWLRYKQYGSQTGPGKVGKEKDKEQKKRVKSDGA